MTVETTSAETSSSEDQIAEFRQYAVEAMAHNMNIAKDGIYVDSLGKQVNAYVGKPGQIVIPQ